MKIAALTSGLNTPSARFRVRQYIPLLNSAGIEVTDYCPRVAQGARMPGPLRNVRMRYMPPLMAAQSLLNVALRVPGIMGSFKADVTWLERNFVPGLDDLAGVVKRPLVVDIDDAIWLYNPFGSSMIKRLIARADMVFAGNHFLAQWCGQYCDNVHIIATAVDTDRFSPVIGGRNGAGFVVGWTGTSGNFRFLQTIEPALAAFLQQNRDASFLVVADKPPSLPSLPARQVSFLQWTPAIEHTALSQMDVGIMPIDDSDLSRGKCSFKMLQYMAAGLPVIVSPYGMNADILNMGSLGIAAESIDDWIAGLQSLRNDTLRFALGSCGRKIAEIHFSSVSIAKKIADAFLGLG